VRFTLIRYGEQPDAQASYLGDFRGPDLERVMDSAAGTAAADPFFRKLDARAAKLPT
jgi:hypothetical protein